MSNEVLASVTSGPWTAKWRGGRLMDIYHAESESVVECIHAGDDYDMSTYTYPNGVTSEVMKSRLESWASEHGSQYIINVLPYNSH